MSYGPCSCCPSAVAAWSLSQDALDAFPEAALLCSVHLKLLIKGRRDAAAKVARDAERRYCACGNELYLAPYNRPCARCMYTGPATVNVTTEMVPVAIRRGREDA